MKNDEKQKLLRTYPPIYSGNGTAVGIPSTVLEPPNQYKSRWRSIRVMYLTMFLSSVSFSICMSSLWPYLKLLDDKANTDFLGWVVASYSLGQLIASPVFGAWANWRGKSREPLVISMLINVVANVLYSYLESIPSHKATYLIVARTLVGFGAGNVAVVRSYVAGATTLKERTSAMATMSAFQAVGFIIGPVVQSAMVPIGYPGIVHIESIHLDLYTSPAILSAIVGVINIILLFAVFREHRVDNDEDINFSIQESSDKKVIPDYKPDYFAVISSILLFFVILFIFAVFETIATPLSMHMYAWTKKKATLYNSIILGVGGFISIIVFIVIKYLSKRFNERFILLGGFVICLLGFFVYLPWGHNYPPYKIADIDHGGDFPSNITDSTTMANVANLTTIGWTESSSADVTTIGHSNTITDITTAGHYTSRIDDITTTGHLTSSSGDITTLDHLTTVDLTTDGRHTTETKVISSQSLTSEEQTTVMMTSFNTDISTGQTTREHFPGATTERKTSSNIVQINNVFDDSSDIINKDKNKLYSIQLKQHNMTTELPLTTTIVSNKSSDDVEAVGCPDSYDWCSYTPIISFPQFIIGTLLIVIGYPTCNVMSYTLYSKILGPKPQGMMMGWLTASGSLARTVGPIFVSQIYNYYGPRVTFVTMIIVIFLTIIVYLLVFKRLIPFRFTKDVDPPSEA